jgi:hypothetical protein
VCGEVGLHRYFTWLKMSALKEAVGNVVNNVVECLPTCVERFLLKLTLLSEFGQIQHVLACLPCARLTALKTKT